MSLDQLKAIENEIHESITLAVQEHEDKFNEIIKTMIPENHKLYARMGLCFLENENGNYYENELTQYLTPFVHNDYFLVSLEINEINVKEK